MDEEGWTPNPDVYVKGAKRSLVLDKNGDPYSIDKRNPIGFNLTMKNNEGNK